MLHSRAILAGNEPRDRDPGVTCAARRPSWAIPSYRNCSTCPSRSRCCLSRSSTSCPTTPTTRLLWSRELREALAPGSYVVISHGTTDGQPAHVAEGMRSYAQTTADFQPRSHAEVLRFFDGLDLVDPGLVFVPRWRPDDPGEAGRAQQIAAYGGAGRKP